MLWLFLCLFFLLLDLLLSRQAFFSFWLCLPGASVPGGAAPAESETPGVVVGIPGGPGGNVCARGGQQLCSCWWQKQKLQFLQQQINETHGITSAHWGRPAMGRTPLGHPFPGLLCALGSQCGQQLGEMTSRNPRQLAWKIPGSLIYSQNMFA